MRSVWEKYSFYFQLWIVSLVVCFKFPQPKFPCFTKGWRCCFILAFSSNWCPTGAFHVYLELTPSQAKYVQPGFGVFFAKSVNSWFCSVILWLCQCQQLSSSSESYKNGQKDIDCPQTLISLCWESWPLDRLLGGREILLKQNQEITRGIL